MSNALYDVIVIGNAIVDVISAVPESQIIDFGINKGAMTIIDIEQAEKIYGLMDKKFEASGGSAANTLAGLSSLGGKGAFIGKVKNDSLGKIFCEDLMDVGVVHKTIPSLDGPPTARCLVFVTPDAERTMQTYLGISVELGPEDIDHDSIISADITYLEGYLFDPPKAQQAFISASKIAHNANRKVALSLSDAFCVDRHRSEFIAFISDHADILFANEAEITSLFEVDSFEEAVKLIQSFCKTAVLTRGVQGCTIVESEKIFEVQACRVENVVDTTGAGDLFAAGFLFGLSNGQALPDCGKLGSIAAAEIITHFGARPEKSLAKLVLEKRA